MKVWEIDLSIRSNYIDSNGFKWATDNVFGTLTGVDCYADIMERHSLKELMSLNFEPFVDWSKVEVDTPCLVKAVEDGNWMRRYFAGIFRGEPRFWAHGSSSWSASSVDSHTFWKYYKLADTTKE